MKRPIFCFLFFFTVCSVGTFGYDTQLVNRLPGGVAVPLLWLIADNYGEADFTVNAHPANDTRTAGWVTQVSTLIQDIDRCTVIAVVQQQDGMVSGNPQVITYLSSMQPRLMDWGFQENKNQMLDFLQGYCPELIVFDRYLSPFECRRVENYLAIKYGITLQGSYYGADGRMLWDNDTYADYHHRIVALGKDAAGNLFHGSSSSVESDTLNLSVSCSIMDETADGSYLLAGDNDGSLLTIVRDGSHWHVCGRQWTVRTIADTLCLSADRQVYGDNHVTFNFHPDFNSDFLKVDTRCIFLLVDDSRNLDAADCDQMRRMPCATRDQGKLTFDKITWNKEGSSRMMLAWYDGNLDDLKPTAGAEKQSGSDFGNESKRMGIAESMGKEALTIIAEKSHVGEYKARLTTTSHCEATLVVFDSNGTKILEKSFHVYGQPTSVTVSESGGTFNYTTAEYDSGNPTHLVSVTRKLNNTQSAITTFEYDEYGNVTKKTMPDNGLWYSYYYDNEVCMYVEQITDAFGLSSSAEHNYEYGVTTKTTDANNAYTKTIFDKKGRLKSISLPNDNQEAASMEISYTPKYGNTPAHATTTYYLRQNVAGSGIGSGTDIKESVSFADGFGRIVQTRSERMLNGSSSKSVVITGCNDYDAFGRVVKSFYPTVAGGSQLNSYSHVSSSEDGTTYTYDALDRTLSEGYPDGHGTSMSYYVADGRLETTLTDANGNSRTKCTNGSGKTVSTTRYDDYGNAVTTTFSYDGFGRTTSVCDAGNNQTDYTYDMGDRLVSVSHPASGTTAYRYDELGNVTRKTTAGDEQIDYSYDRGRLTSITYPNHPANNVSFYYGDNSQQDGRKGRIVFREDGSGGIEYEYDNMGNVKTTLRTLIIPGHGKATFRTQWLFDNYGKLLQMRYPDNDVVTYKYNDCGDLTKVFSGVNEYSSPRTYVESVAYDKYGRRSVISYGNGTQTSYAYDESRNWLSGVSVAAGNSLMDRRYQHDFVGNITGISDNNALEHRYIYDAMDRLVCAEGTYGETTSAEHTKYKTETEYDGLYRTLYKSYEKMWPNNTTRPYYGYGLTYNYRNDRKYRLNSVVRQSYADAGHTAIGTGTTYDFDYDDKGNQTMEGYEDWYCWDEENRMTGALRDDRQLSSYIYDADGIRTYRNSQWSICLLVNSQQQHTSSVMYYNLYPNEYYVVHNGNSYSKHVYMDGERIATLVGSNNSLLDGYSGSNVDVAGVQFIQGNPDAYYASKCADKEDDLMNSLENDFGKTYYPSYLQNTVIYNGAQVTDLPYYYHHDHLGSTCLVTDSLGNVDQRIEYMPDGSIFFQTVNGSYSSPFRFNGQEFDDDTELYYYGARYYDRKLGIWTSSDPMELDYPGISSYAYCAGNPMNRVDIDGKKILPVYISNINESGQSIGVRYLSNTKVINAMKEFGKTTYGKSLLESFVPKGFSQYGVKGNGKYSKYVLKILEVDISNNHQRFSIIGNRKGWLDIEEKNGTLFFVMGLDVSDLSSNELIETIVHELTLHGYNIDNTIRAFEKGGFKSARKVFFSTPPSLEHNDVNETVHKYGGGLYIKTKEEILNAMPQLKKEFNK